MISLLVALLLVQDPSPKKETPVDEVTITAPKAPPPVEPGPAAHQVDEKELERFDYDDPHRVLRLVPGVSIREEDGYGLRPNIGMRGTSPERSAKITLMEDGILFAPAPYSAPAAYYYPMSTRIVGVDAYTGPGILRFGPLLTGGALDLRTRAIPREWSGAADVAAGSFGYGKAHLWVGGEEEIGVARVGVLLDGVHARSDGFKELDGGGDTGFEKTEIMLKAAATIGDHRFGLKFGYSTEESDETYLGLTDDDFDADPYRRYRGSQLDRMEWDRSQFEVTHEVEIARGWRVASALYHHDFDRVWSKVNRFQGGPDLNVILANPTQPVNAVYYAVLTGAQDTASSDENLLIGTNDRRFLAQGIQSDVGWELLTPGGRIDRAFQGGLRFHRDEAVRFHTEDAYRMEGGELLFNGDPELVTTDSTATAEALSLHAGYVHRIGDFLLAPRARAEFIRTRLEDHATGESDDDSSAILLPGFLATYEISAEWSAKAGVYRGFSPKAPGQAEEIDPETSVVYEVGGSYEAKETRVSATAFLNHYENLLAEDTFSGGGSGTGEQFNGGEVQVFGVEIDARRDFPLVPGLKVPLVADYTFQSSEFLTSFSSGNPQWGDVEEGDELPYLPEHQLTVSAGLQGETWDLSILVNWMSWMREVAGTGEPIRYEKVPARTVVDLSGSWSPFPGKRVYAKMLNVFDEEYLVSHRPFGARPGTPLQFQFGFDVKF